MPCMRPCGCTGHQQPLGSTGFVTPLLLPMLCPRRPLPPPLTLSILGILLNGVLMSALLSFACAQGAKVFTHFHETNVRAGTGGARHANTHGAVTGHTCSHEGSGAC